MYTFYNIKTGKITGFLSDSKPELNVTEEENFVEGYYSEKEYYIKDKKPTLIEESVLQEEKINNAKNLLRARRNELLLESDYKILSDSTTTKLEEWKTYRQALRDLPANTSDPLDVTWPTPPE